MREEGLPVNLITYNAAITALSKASRQRNKSSSYSSDDMVGEGLWSRALLLLGQMKKDGIDPDGFCYSSAISCCGAEGRWEEALKLIEVMKQGGPRTRPNKIAYTAAIGACGRAGESTKALELFQSMKEDGLSADRVAYNTLFSALRVAGDANNVRRDASSRLDYLSTGRTEKEKTNISSRLQTFQLWREMCGTGGSTQLPSGAIAAARSSASPDIITVTDCLATLHRAGMQNETDQIFQEAVARGIVLRGNALDSQWETDLSGMSIPVASASCRYIMSQALAPKALDDMQDITFITGVGKSQQQQQQQQQQKEGVPNKKATLRDYIQDLLKRDFHLESFIPPRAQGTVVVKKEDLMKASQRVR
eukprot:scaffold3515_cov126-Cylindrotheca_fusiformis.AAC.25